MITECVKYVGNPTVRAVARTDIPFRGKEEREGIFGIKSAFE